MKRFKLLPVWAAVSAVIIIAGVLLMGLLGFNTASDRSRTAVLEVQYNVVVKNSDAAVKELEGVCEDALAEQGIGVLGKQTSDGVNDSQEWTTLRYTVSAEDAEKLGTVMEKVASSDTQTKLSAAIAEETDGDSAVISELIEFYPAVHTEELVSEYDWLWRGAAAVGIVAALIYVGIRFGVGAAVTGLTVAVHDALFALSLLAIVRIPVFAAAPALYALIAAAISLALWIVHCCRIREITKVSEQKLGAEETVALAYRGVFKTVVISVCLVACAIVLCSVAGFIAAPSLAAAFAPMIVCALSAGYSSLLLGPALHVHVKGAFDKLKKQDKPRYVGKQKQTEE